MPGLLDKAIARRAELFNLPASAAYGSRDVRDMALRIFDGLGDGLADHEIDSFANRWLVATRSSHIDTSLHEELRDSGHTVYHKRLDQHQKESPVHLFGPAQNSSFNIIENGLKFEVSFQSGYSQGIFLDQRDNRRRIIEYLEEGQTLLNTFAYTGAFSVCAASTGGISTTLDLSQPYLDWAKRNMQLNEIDPASQYFCKGDTFHWLKRFAKQGREFDFIVLDPPTFSRDNNGKVFRVEKDYGYLVELAAACLKKGGTILACTNNRQINDKTFTNMVQSGFNKPISIESLPMPPDFTAPKYLKSLWITS